MPGPHGAPRGGYQKPKNMGKTIRRLLGYLTRSPLPLLLVLGCLAVSVGTNLGGSYMLRGIINDYLDPSGPRFGDMAGLGLAIARLIVIYVAGAAAAYLQSATMVRLAQRGTNRLRKELFDALQDLPLSYFDAHPHGELMSRFTNDADNVQMALEQSLVSMISSGLMFVGLVALMVTINWRLFLVTLAVLVLTMLLFKAISSRSRSYYAQQQSALGALNGNIQETIEGLRVVKAFTHEEKATADFAALNEAYRQAARKAGFFSGIIGPVNHNLMNISYALTACVGGLLSVLQGFDLGGLVVYLNYSKQIGQPINQVSQQMTAILSALAGAERIFDVMDTPPEIDEGKVRLTRVGEREWAWQKPDGTLVPLKGDVRFEDVSFSYVPGKPILKHISLYAEPSQKLAFVGATGAMFFQHGAPLTVALAQRVDMLEGDCQRNGVVNHVGHIEI